MKEKIILIGIGLILLLQLIMLNKYDSMNTHVQYLASRISQLDSTVSSNYYDIENNLYEIQEEINKNMITNAENFAALNNEITETENLDITPVVEDLISNPEENMKMDLTTYMDKKQPYLKFQVTFLGELNALIINPKIKLYNESTGSYVMNALEQDGNTYTCSFKLLKDTSYSYSVIGNVRNKTLNTELELVNSTFLYHYETFTYDASLSDNQLSLSLGLETIPPVLDELRVQNITFKIFDDANILLDTLNLDALCNNRYDMSYKEISLEKLMVLIAAGEFNFKQDITTMNGVPEKVEIQVMYGTGEVDSQNIHINELD